MGHQSGEAYSMEIMDDHAVIHSLDSDHDSSASMTALGTMEDETDAFEEEPSYSPSRFQSQQFEESKFDQGEYRAAPGNHFKNRYSYASVVKDRGIHIDLTQAWQRSMLLQLEKLDHGLEVRPERKPELMVLGHAESRDFAFAIEKDDVTLATAASSACPTKDQTIYRLDSTCNTSVGNAHCLPQNYPHHTAESRRSRARYSPREAMSINDDKSEQKCQDNFPLYDCGVAQYDTMEAQQPFSRMMVNPCRGGDLGSNFSGRRARSNVNQRHDSRSQLDASISEENDPSSGSQEACFCLGYNILDYWIPPVPRGSEQFRTRSSQKRPRQLRHTDEGHKAETRPIQNVKMPSRSGQIHHRDPSGSYAYQTFEDRDDLLMT